MKRILSLLIIPILMTSCNSRYQDNEFKIISPSGAPCLSLYNYINSGNVDINTVPSNVNAQLLNDNYDVIITEFYKGLKTINNNDSCYELKRIVTGGNLYLVGINKPQGSEPTEDSLVVSFNSGSIPDKTYLAIYKNSGARVEYVSSNSEVIPVLKTGKYAGENADFVLIAEPALTTVMKTLNKDNYSIISLREKYGEVFNDAPFIPQAGLFVNKKKYQIKQNTYDLFLSQIEKDIDLAINNPQEVKNVMDKMSKEEQKNKYSFTSDIMIEVQQTNGFGLVPSNAKFDLEKFLNNVIGE